MRNFVIINGVNSNTINGLGINELPPITKPEMRNIREEIDGRDGDIITNLGYSAYDKTITIGLFGTGYDINNIVAFFNGEGTIVFSNEPDKYYNFKILNQIDYEALQKFKQASITFHCQPFKYPLSETPLEIEYDYIEQEGETLTLNNTGNSTLKLDLKGNTTQTGTPTPTSPIPVSVVSGDNDVVVCGKNLFDNDKAQIGKAWNNGSNSARAIVLTKVEPNTQYTISYYSISGIDGLYWFGRTNEDDSVPSMPSSDVNTNPKIITTDANTNYLGIQFNKTNINLNDIKTVKIQIEKGNSSTPYEPYQSQTYEVDLPVGLELCKIGNYQDRIYKDNGNWYIEKNINKIVLDGTETWTNQLMNGSYGYSTQITNVVAPAIATELPKTFCNYYPVKTPSQNWSTPSGDKNYCINNSNTTTAYLRFSNGEATNKVADFKTWLGTYKPVVYYVLASPTTTLIEDNNLIEQLDNIQNAVSYTGQTNISQVNNDKAFIISAKALEKGTNEVVVNNIGNVYSKPLLALEGNGNVDIYLDNTQILKANVEDKMNIDIAQLEAYNPDTMTLLNRQVIGNYNSMTLQPGNNTIRIDGALDKATITNYTRWL